MSQKHDTALARKIVARALDTEVHQIHPIQGQGIINVVFRIETNLGIAVLRCNAADDEHQNYAVEAWAIDQVAAVGIPVPEVLVVGEQDGVAYMIQRFIEGESGHDRAENHLEVWRQLGGYARKFNAITVEGFGSDMDPTQLGRFQQTWPEVVEEYQQCVFRDNYWVRDAGLSSHLLERMRHQISELSELDLPAGLALCDMGPDNTITTPDGTLVMIDWEMVEGSPAPHVQIAKVASYWGYSSTRMDAFVEGYGLARAEVQEMEPKLKALTCLYSLNHVRWAQDHMPERVDEYTESARHIATELYGNT